MMKSEDSGEYWRGRCCENGMFGKSHDCLKGNSVISKPLLKKATASLPSGCYCKPGQCAAPVIMGMQMPCRDPIKAAAGNLIPADHKRIRTQREAVKEVMKDGHWRTLFWISDQCLYKYGVMAPEASVSARIREFPHEKRRVREGRGLWEYRATK